MAKSDFIGLNENATALRGDAGDGEDFFLPLAKIKEIDIPEERHWVLAQYIHLLSAHNGWRPDNKGHHEMCLFEANILGITPDEILFSCAKWAHQFDYAPGEIKEISI